MPKGFDYEAALEKAGRPPELTEEQSLELRSLREETAPAIQAEQAAEGRAAQDRQTGRGLLRQAEINHERSAGSSDGDDYEEVDKIIDGWLEKRQDRQSE